MHNPWTQTIVWGRPGEGWERGGGVNGRKGNICTTLNNKDKNYINVFGTVLVLLIGLFYGII